MISNILMYNSSYMVNQLFETFALFTKNVTKSHSYHLHLQRLVEKIVVESSPSLNSFNLDLGTCEEIATLLAELIKIDQIQVNHTEIFKNLQKNMKSLSNNLKKLKLEKCQLEKSFRSDLEFFSKNMTQLIIVHKEYKARCQFAFLDYLKGVDIDIRKILKPLVPCSVVKEQIKFPSINSNPSLSSSFHSVHESVEADSEREVGIQSQPEPGEVTIQKLNAHIQMLVNTLESLAKDLMQVLAETNREYYQLLNNQEVYSRPPTPLAAPLPDYFCFELQETPRDLVYKQVLASDTKTTWSKRLKKLHESKGIADSLYHSLMNKLKNSAESKKLDLKELFSNAEVPVSQREHLVYYLINGSTEFDLHVSMSQILDEVKLKPEPPKFGKPKGKLYYKVEKETEKRMSPINPDQEVARISQASPIQQARVINSIRTASRSPKIERLFKSRKSVGMRSVTPVNKEKTSKIKPRTPSIQNNKVSFGTLNAKHRLRKNL